MTLSYIEVQPRPDGYRCRCDEGGKGGGGGGCGILLVVVVVSSGLSHDVDDTLSVWSPDYT